MVNYFMTFIFNGVNFLSEIFTLNTPFFNGIRSFLLKLIGIKIQGNCFIDRGFRFLCPRNIYIGKNVSLGHYNRIWAFNKVLIGDYVQSAIGLTIIAGSHNIDDYSPISKNQEIIIEGENWIGANVTIIGGVTVGRGTIIGSGSVVVKDLPPYTICVGNPCKVIRNRKPSTSVISPFGHYKPNFFK